MDKEQSFGDYFEEWIDTYKRGFIRNVTLEKYVHNVKWIRRLMPDLKVKELSRITYQELINKYAEFHEKQTTMDFHHQLKASIMDALDEGFIEKDPTRKVVIKGKKAGPKKKKFLSQFELQLLLRSLELDEDRITWEWCISLIAKTGLRFSEALGLTPKDFDFNKLTIKVNKTWNYKEGGGFDLTKNKTSNREITVDLKTMAQFKHLIKDLPENEPIFVTDTTTKSKYKRVYNSTLNNVLDKYCKKAGVSEITVHGLRHTHASLLLLQGVSIPSVSKRLGHANVSTTQEVYLHVVKELENKDTGLIMGSIMNLEQE